MESKRAGRARDGAARPHPSPAPRAAGHWRWWPAPRRGAEGSREDSDAMRGSRALEASERREGEGVGMRLAGGAPSRRSTHEGGLAVQGLEGGETNGAARLPLPGYCSGHTNAHLKYMC
jgi:hypothetical protein